MSVFRLYTACERDCRLQCSVRICEFREVMLLKGIALNPMAQPTLLDIP